MAGGGRLPRAAGRPPRFLRTGHQRRAIRLSDAHLHAAWRDAGHTLGREAEGVLQSLLFHRASRGLRAQRATFRVLAEGEPDVDAALASAVGCPPPPRSVTPLRPPLSDQRGRAARRCGATQIVREQSPRRPIFASDGLLLCLKAAAEDSLLRLDQGVSAPVSVSAPHAPVPSSNGMARPRSGLVACTLSRRQRLSSFHAGFAPDHRCREEPQAQSYSRDESPGLTAPPVIAGRSWLAGSARSDREDVSR